MKTDCVYQIQDNFIDLSKIKTFRIAKRYSNDSDKRIVEIQLMDIVHIINGERENILPGTIDIIFDSEHAAKKACKELSEEWEKFIKENSVR